MGCDIKLRVQESMEITKFQKRVYLALLEVPRGKTITYGELARRVGCRSAQAIGQALRRNPFAPDVPCHRVICANGDVGGYFGHRDGEYLSRKLALLREESDERTTTDREAKRHTLEDQASPHIG